MDIHSIHIHDSQTENIASTPPQSNENFYHDNASLNCLIWVLVLLLGIVCVVLYHFYWILKKILYPFYWIPKKISKYRSYYILFFAFLGVLGLVGPLCLLTFPFLLASSLVLRLSQFIKKGEDYDKVTQVKMVVEWFMVTYLVLLGAGLLIFSTFVDTIFKRKTHIKVQGKPLFAWGNYAGSAILIVCGIRFILFWIIQRFMPRMTLEYNDSGLKVIQATSDIVDGFLLYFVFSVMNYLPQLKPSELTSETWIGIFIIVLIGWNIITLITHLIVWSIHKLVSLYLNRVDGDKERLDRYILLERLLSVKCLVYYGNGIKRSFNFMLSSLLLLLVWVFYFGPRLKKTDSKAKIVSNFGTWTCTVLLILSFLWILKDFVLLSWEANAVYDRLSSKILEARKSLYFLGMLGRHSHDILKLRYELVKEDNQYYGKLENKAQIFMAKNLGIVDAYYRDKSDEDDNDEMEVTGGGTSRQLQPKLSNKKRARAKHDLLLLKTDAITLFDIQQLAKYFLTAANALSSETYTSDILRKLTASDNRKILKKLITGKNILSDSVLQDWKYFEGLLDLEVSDPVSHSKVKVWLERSHNKCLFLANTLCSTKDVVGCLNNIISVALIFASFILWLIFNGLANTKTLVLIASPLLAATFIFGDTCKTLFQGIIFVYVVHPFDVGDLCVIDEKMMEVKSIGVWKTTFSNIDKVGTYEELIYPNSELALKMFINHKTEFDWNDLVELDIDHLDKLQIEELRTQIENLLEDKKDESMPGSHSVSVISTGKDMKIAVRFRHNKHNVDMTYFECVKEKDKLRSTFLLDLQNLICKSEDKN